jgi:hypothetical protein
VSNRASPPFYPNHRHQVTRQKAFLGNVTLSIDMNQIRMIVLAESRQHIVLAEKKRERLLDVIGHRHA